MSAPVPTRARHVHAVDVVRVLTFAAVIAVHVVGHVNGSRNVTANAAEMLLHFTREAFFVLTGFVLAHQYAGRRINLRRFYPRRALTVGVPYVVWSAIYTGVNWYSGARPGSVAAALREFWSVLINGTAFYHLYFLLVSLQIYLLFPLISALLRVTRRHHVALLVVSALLEIAAMTVLQYFRPSGGGIVGALVEHRNVLVVTYQFYVLLGAVVALHLDAVTAWVRAHTAAVLALVIAGAAAAEIWYATNLHRGHSTVFAAAVLQPVMVPWAVTIVLALFALGSAWSVHRTAGSRLDRFLRTGSDRSFGIYLSHPLVLWLILRTRRHWLPQHLPQVVLTAVVYAGTVLGAVLITELARRSPVSLPLTGRSRLRPSRPARPTAREEPAHAPDHAQPARPRREAPHDRHDDGDRQRPADAVLHRSDGEFQPAD